MVGDGSKAVRMGDIAQRVGVSRTAVSFVLNNRDDGSVSPATRERILRAAEELGYRPHAGARALAAQRSGWYGLVTEIVTSPFAVETVIRARRTASWREGKFLLIAATRGRSRTRGTRRSRSCWSSGSKGCSTPQAWHRAVTLPPIAFEVPTVLVNCFDADGQLPSIVPDEVGGGHSATRRLLDAGHTRIGFINLDPAIAGSASAGSTATAGPCVEAGYRARDDLADRRGDSTADGGYTAACELLDLAGPPDRDLLRQRPDGDGCVRRHQGTWAVASRTTSPSSGSTTRS